MRSHKRRKLETRICRQSRATDLRDDGNGLINVRQSDLLKKPVADNWLSYNGDYTGARYSSLTQITPGNVARLTAQWVFHPRAVSPLEVTPVVVAGVMFVTSANDAYALDAKTGKVLWHHMRAVSPRA